MPRMRFKSNLASGSRVSPLAALISASRASAVRVSADFGLAPCNPSVLPASPLGAPVLAALGVAARAFAVESSALSPDDFAWLLLKDEGSTLAREPSVGPR